MSRRAGDDGQVAKLDARALFAEIGNDRIESSPSRPESNAVSARSIAARVIWPSRASARAMAAGSRWKASLTSAGTACPLATASAARTT